MTQRTSHLPAVGVPVPPFVGVTTAVAGDRLTVAVSGELDATARGTVQSALADALDDAHPSLVDVDLAAVTFCDMGGVRVLLSLYDALLASGIACRIRRPPPRVVWLLRFTGAAGQLGLTA